MKIGIIVGSVRNGRVSGHIADWVRKKAKELEDTEAELIDLRTFNLPIFDEDISPKYNPDRKPVGVVKSWLDELAGQDAYVIVSPEYNRSIPGVLKNAFDHVAYEMANKPAALVSHGSYKGAFAISHLRTILPELGVITVPAFIGLPYGSFDTNGTPQNDLGQFDKPLADMLDSLKKYSVAIQPASSDA